MEEENTCMILKSGQHQKQDWWTTHPRHAMQGGIRSQVRANPSPNLHGLGTMLPWMLHSTVVTSLTLMALVIGLFIPSLTLSWKEQRGPLQNLSTCSHTLHECPSLCIQIPFPLVLLPNPQSKTSVLARAIYFLSFSISSNIAKHDQAFQLHCRFLLFNLSWSITRLLFILYFNHCLTVRLDITNKRSWVLIQHRHFSLFYSI